MSRLARQWLEDNCKFSTKDSISLEHDLSNGYIILLLLKQHDILSIDDFESASDTNDPSTTINNFKILTRALKKIKITLTKQDTGRVMIKHILFT